MIAPMVTRLWVRIQEPKIVTLYQFAIYLVIAFTGLAAWFFPPASVEGAIGPILTRMLATFLLVGGVLGASVVLPGVWWLERAAVLSCATGAGIYGSVVLSLQVTQAGSRFVQMGVILWAILSISQRWHRIRRYPFDPER